MVTFKKDLVGKDTSNKFYLWIGLSPIFMAAILSLIILLFFKFLPPKLPLFYSLPWGDRQLINHQQFFILPASIVLIALANLIISWQLHLTQAFFKKALLLSAFIISLILTITFIKIMFIFI